MQTLEELFCESKLVKEAQLLSAARKAVHNPEHGITITLPIAKIVIKDCALITTKYLSFWVIAHYTNVFSSFKPSLEQIKDFCERAKTDFTVNQLKTLLLEQAIRLNPLLEVRSKVDNSDPYNDFEVNPELQQHHTDVFLLSKSFGVI